MRWPRFYPIFDTCQWLEQLLPLGIPMVQLRIKNQPEKVVRAQIRQAKALCDQYNTLLVINDYWRLAIEEGCQWLHLGQEDLAEADLGAIRRASLKLGISTHDEEELDRALAAQPDYIALGPVWPTRLKKMKWHRQGLDRVRQWKQRIGTLPLIAIGGLSVERAPQAFAAGADTLSVVTDITWHNNPKIRVQQWLKATV